MDTVDLKDWGLKGDDSLPLGIVGPCSAETEEQVMATAKDLIHKNVHVFRAGVWKPRTKPGTFEGVGEPGLQWLNKVRDTYGLKVGTEVATRDHVRLAIQYKMDMLWVGARTTVNPFAVQEIADAIKEFGGLDIPVLVKNPINPDLDLWIGGLERLNAVGVKKLGAIHRGFSTYEKIQYRNAPKWQIPIEFKRRLPNIPVICDPSHIAGNRELLFSISQTALNLNFDGLMIESHVNPDEAWSDAKQQVVPARAIEMTEELQLRKEQAENTAEVKKLDALRTQIDELDHRLIAILGQRMDVARQIGEVKKSSNVAVLQANRWDELLEDRKQKGEAAGLSDKFTKKFLDAVHEESINKQDKLMK
ncbi:MAG: bifunctional 3-deoxy-7-phosphoheptulonate synthase/chorismate mutase type II [Ichthyobacteriaceae bacterium]|nr:bifunctional 3-deoxy-7-phosphoheptulonate synthase/chorismate mutase type II [Ichthyobacteriaceae bacterium]